MRTVLAHIIGLVVGIAVVIFVSKIVYGSVEARPWWTTAIGVGVWWGIAGLIKSKKIHKSQLEKNENNLSE